MNNIDKEFMAIALEEGKKAFAEGDYPVGAALVVDGKLIGKINNASMSKKTWGDHAETQLLLAHSQAIREMQAENPNINVELYSTLEPCLMCLGCAMMHRVKRIIFSLHDPRGGATSLDIASLPSFYSEKWPMIDSGLFKEESYDMFDQWMANQTTKQYAINRKLFAEMKAGWK